MNRLRLHFPALLLMLATLLGGACQSGDIASLPEAKGGAGAPLADPAGTRVLLLGSGTWNGDSGAFELGYLAPTGFQQLDWQDVETSTPTLGQLLTYDAVAVYTNVPPVDPVATGDVLADYVDAGGGVVVASYVHTASWGVTGRFKTSGYSPFNFDALNPNTARSFGTVHQPGHPLLTGVTDVTSSSQENPSLRAGAELVVSWDTGEPAVAHTPSGSVVGLALAPADAGTLGDFAKLIGNALLFAAAH